MAGRDGSRGGDGVRVRWAFAPAARVEAVLPRPEPGQPPDIVPLRQQPDRSFAGRVPGPRSGEIALLITLPDGRAVWDQLTVQDVHSGSSAGNTVLAN